LAAGFNMCASVDAEPGFWGPRGAQTKGALAIIAILVIGLCPSDLVFRFSPQ